jgi:cytochrome c oxidase subunit 3
MSPNVWIQMQWPPVGIEAIGWEGRALVMSAVLAASYYSANVAMVAKDPKVGGSGIKGGVLTELLSAV